MNRSELQFVRYWWAIRRATHGEMPSVSSIIGIVILVAFAARLALLITLAFALFVQLADELPRPTYQVLTDLCDDLPETFAASWATLDTTNSQMSLPRLSISTSPSKVLQTVLFLSLFH